MGEVHGPTTAHALDVVEAGYSLDGTDSDWLAGILQAARLDIEHTGGSYAFTTYLGPLTPSQPGGPPGAHGDGASPGIAVGPAYAERGLDARLAAAVKELNRTVPPAFFEWLARTAILCGGFLQSAPEWLHAHLRENTPSGTVQDSFALFVQDGEGWALNITAPTIGRVHVPPRIRGVWKRVGLHLASGMRLRRRLRCADVVSAHARAREGLFTPDGGVAHLEQDLHADRSARDALVAGVRSIERARTARGRADPERAFELWRGLVAGEWSLVDQWESDGRRYLAAYRNRPDLRDPRGLTRLEGLVLRYVSRAASSKEVAFTLGVSQGAVDTAVSRLMRKLHCHRRSDLLAFDDASAARTLAVDLGDDAIDVLSLPNAPASAPMARLSPAERAIAGDVARGKTNSQIADARNTSSNTVAKQIRSIFEKLGVRSRLELAAAISHG